MNSTNNKIISAVACACFAILVTAAQATPISFVTPTGSTDAAGDPVNAKVTFTMGAGTVTILLENKQTGEKDVGQNLSDLLFTMSTGQNSGTLSSSSGLERTVAGNKTFTDGSTVAAGWVLSTSGTNLLLDVLSGPGNSGPAHTILGLPTGSSYPNAMGSIAGNGPHNPFLAESATFVVSVPGVTAASTISGATFSFGTTAGDNIPGIPVPEPSTLILAGLGGLSLLIYRSRRAARSRA
jgi:hypothetical protein